MWHPTPLCKMHHQNNGHPRKAPKKRTMNFKDLVQSLLFYVGIPAVTLYPLGFAALAIQLWNDPLFPYYDFDTVWYAVTLVPKTQVIGSALKLIFISLAATAVSAGSPCGSLGPCAASGGSASKGCRKGGKGPVGHLPAHLVVPSGIPI